MHEDSAVGTEETRAEVRDDHPSAGRRFGKMVPPLQRIEAAWSVKRLFGETTGEMRSVQDLDEVVSLISPQAGSRSERFNIHRSLCSLSSAGTYLDQMSLGHAELGQLQGAGPRCIP